jgi:hypothetical protein
MPVKCVRPKSSEQNPKDPASEEIRSRRQRTARGQLPNDRCRDAEDDLLADAAHDADVDGGVISDVVRRCIEAGQREEDKDAVQDGQRGCAELFGLGPQNRCASCDQPDGGDVREGCDARNVIAPGLEWLMAGVELAPDEIQDAGGDGRNAIHVSADSHDRATCNARPC